MMADPAYNLDFLLGSKRPALNWNIRRRIFSSRTVSHIWCERIEGNRQILIGIRYMQCRAIYTTECHQVSHLFIGCRDAYNVDRELYPLRDSAEKFDFCYNDVKINVELVKQFLNNLSIPEEAALGEGVVDFSNSLERALKAQGLLATGRKFQKRVELLSNREFQIYEPRTFNVSDREVRWSPSLEFEGRTVDVNANFAFGIDRILKGIATAGRNERRHFARS